MPERMMPIFVTRPARLIGLVLAVVSASGALQAAGIDELAGRWSGWGALRLSNGVIEQVKCVATYFVKDSGTSLDQNLRCASASYKIDAKANYTVEAGVVRGSWEERTQSARGIVAGSVVDNLFKLTVEGDGFTANMTMSSTNCKQSISITPRGLEVDSLSIGLEKC
ncbi:MAG: hypothetical protein KJ622_07545 [Alphaproteobacteria bacterium]|nr:hypothetical protein [Alphaproteobacteria bacterium]